MMLALVGLAAFGNFLLVALRMRHNQRAFVAIALWWTATAVIPTWVGIGFANSQFVLGSLLALACIGLVLTTKGRRFEVNVIDLAMVALVAVFALSAALGGSRSLANDAVLQWSAPYLLVRLTALRVPRSWIHRLIVVVATTVGAWSVLEFFLDLHIFESFSALSLPNLQAIWQSIQYRSGLPRSEGAFGTSITMAAFLAMAMPFVLRCTGLRLAIASSLVLAGAAFTLSRTAGIALAVVVLLLVILRRQRNRWLLIAGGILGVYFALPLVLGTDASSTTQADFAQSSGYRDYVFSNSLQRAHLFGVADLGGAFVSVDNAYLRVAVDTGLAAAAVLLVTMFLPILTILRYRTGPASVAVIAMATSGMAVALITQWQMFVFAMLGLAAQELQEARRRQIVAPGSSVSTNSAMRL